VRSILPAALTLVGTYGQKREQGYSASPLKPPRLTKIPASKRVARRNHLWRLHEEFGISVSDSTIYRALKDLGFSHLSARPKAYKQNTAQPPGSFTLGGLGNDIGGPETDLAGLAIELDRLDRGSAVALQSGDRLQIAGLVEQILR
jgi:hypothetical protein